MKLINEAIKLKKINSRELPENLRTEITDLKEIIVKYNMALEDYEKEEEQDVAIEKQLDEMYNYISGKDKELADEIKAYEPEPEPEPTPELEPPAPEAPAPEPTPAPAKKDNTLNVIIGFGLFVLTLGLVKRLSK